jgi:hypothetical protein
MFKTLFEFIEKHVDKTVILIVVCVLFGAGALYHIEEIIVTEKAFAGEVGRIYEMMQKNYELSKDELKASERATNLRFLQREKESLNKQKSTEKRHLDFLDAQKMRAKPEEKSVWIDKIKRTETEIGIINVKISSIEDKMFIIMNPPTGPSKNPVAHVPLK